MIYTIIHAFIVPESPSECADFTLVLNTRRRSTHSGFP